MNKLKAIVCFMLSVTCAVSAYEYRTWQDKDGSTFTGRFYAELFGKLTIETKEGQKKVLAVSDFSDLDKKYVRVMIPPLIEVEVRTRKIDIPPRPALNPTLEETTDYIASARIDKKSQRPFTGRLQGEFFLIGEDYRSGEHVLLSYTKDTFLLLEEKNYQHVFESKPTRTMLFEGGMNRRPRGDEYLGHILVISSMQGDVVDVQYNVPKWMSEPEVLDNLRELAVRGAASVRSRYFDKKGNKIRPPRPENIQPSYR